MIYLHDIDPVAFSLGPLAVRWYGIAYAVAFVLAWWLGRQRVRAGRLPGVNEDGFSDLLFYMMLGVLLGGRIGYILFYDLSRYIDHPLDVFKVWEGGMSFHGGLLGVMLAAGYWAYKRGLHFFDVADFIAPLAPPGLFVGRFANFINGELWGKYTRANWGVVFPTTDPNVTALNLDAAQIRARFAAGALNQFARHPTQLYEATLEGLAMFAVLWVFSRKPRPRYAVSGLFLLMYGCFRFLIEFVRVPDEQLDYLFAGWVTMGQILSLPLIVLGLALLALSRRSPTLRAEPAAESKP